MRASPRRPQRPARRRGRAGPARPNAGHKTAPAPSSGSQTAAEAGPLRFFRLRRARIAALAWGVFLWTLTSWPSPPELPIVRGIPDFDKLVHAGLYAVESFFLFLSVRWPGRPRFSLARVLAVVGAMAVWGVADEVHQTWIPGRSCEAEDVAADVAGAAAGALVASVLFAGRRGTAPPMDTRPTS